MGRFLSGIVVLQLLMRVKVKCHRRANEARALATRRSRQAVDTR